MRINSRAYVTRFYYGNYFYVFMCVTHGKICLHESSTYRLSCLDTVSSLVCTHSGQGFRCCKAVRIEKLVIFMSFYYNFEKGNKVMKDNLFVRILMKSA
jgi:hypothetical protein